MSASKDKEMSFLDHLEDLRWTLLRAILSVFAFASLALVFNRTIFDYIILAPKSPDFFTNRLMCQLAELLDTPALCINSEPLQIININMAGQFTTFITTSIVAGIILAFPYIFYEFWKFIAPALYDNEKKNSRGAVFFTSFLFILGILFGFYIICPLSVNFLGTFNVSETVTNQINLQSYISTITSITLASGVLFELPMLIYFLSKVGIATPEGLKKYRRHSIIASLGIAALITPPDIYSQVLVCVPLIFLYEIGIHISRRVQRKRARS